MPRSVHCKSRILCHVVEEKVVFKEQLSYFLEMQLGHPLFIISLKSGTVNIHKLDIPRHILDGKGILKEAPGVYTRVE